ncbi:MAG: hypothetical protein RR478_05545 [Bacilli bacterium]
MEDLINKEVFIMEELGESEFLQAILRALSDQERKDIFDFIIRMYLF